MAKGPAKKVAAKKAGGKKAAGKKAAKKAKPAAKKGAAGKKKAPATVPRPAINVDAYLKKRVGSSAERLKAAKALVELAKKATGKPPVLWSSSADGEGFAIVGFGSAPYAGKTCAGDWPVAGVSVAPEGKAFSVHLGCGGGALNQAELRTQLKCPALTAGVSCMKFKPGSVDEKELAKVIKSRM